jgi:hypothetical protein
MKSTLFMVDIVLDEKIKRLQEVMVDFKETLIHIKNQQKMNDIIPPQRYQIETPKPRRKRKKKSEIERNFACNIDNCQRSYGSENSLNQHMKIKHPDFWMRVKEKEQNLTAINNYNIQDPRFTNPQALLAELEMNKSKLKPYEYYQGDREEREEVRMDRNFNMREKMVEEASDSEDYQGRKRGRQFKNFEG